MAPTDPNPKKSATPADTLTASPDIAMMATHIFAALASATYGYSDPNLAVRLQWAVSCARKIAAEVERTDGEV